MKTIEINCRREHLKLLQNLNNEVTCKTDTEDFYRSTSVVILSLFIFLCFSIICLTKTWETNDYFRSNSNFKLPSYNSVYFERNLERGGGICFFSYRKM